MNQVVTKTVTKPLFPGRPPRSELAAREDKLLSIALELFIRHGYGEVSLALLARVAHTAVRTIYVKFGGKPGLLLAVIAAEQVRHQAQLDLLPGGAQQPATQDELLARLELLAAHLLRRAGDPGLMRLLEIVAAEGAPEAVAALHRGGPGLLAEVILALFAGPQAQAVFGTEFAPAELCSHFFNCVAGNRALKLETAEVTPEQRAQRGLKLFLHGALRSSP